MVRLGGSTMLLVDGDEATFFFQKKKQTKSNFYSHIRPHISLSTPAQVFLFTFLARPIRSISSLIFLYVPFLSSSSFFHVFFASFFLLLIVLFLSLHPSDTSPLLRLLACLLPFLSSLYTPFGQDASAPNQSRWTHSISVSYHEHSPCFCFVSSLLCSCLSFEKAWLISPSCCAVIVQCSRYLWVRRSS